MDRQKVLGVSFEINKACTLIRYCAVRMNAKSRLVRRKWFGRRGKLNFGCPKEIRPPAKKLRVEEEDRRDHVGERIHSVKIIDCPRRKRFEPTPW